MTDTLKLHEITPFLINRSMKLAKHSDSDSLDYIFTDSSRWFDQNSVILKLTQMPSFSAMELTLKFLPACSGGGDYGITAIEEAANIVYKLYSAVLQAKTLGKKEIDLTQILVGRYGFNFMAKLVNTSKAFLVLKQDETPVSKPKNSILALPDLPRGTKAVKRYIELQFA